MVEYKIIKNFKAIKCPVIVGCFENEIVSVSKNLQQQISDMNLKYDYGCISKVYTMGFEKYPEIIIVGLGKKEELTDTKLFRVFGKLMLQINGEVTIILDTFINENNQQKFANIIMSSIMFYSYNFDTYKTNKKEKNLYMNIVSKESVEEELREAFMLGVAQSNARDLVNTPYMDLNAVDLAKYAKELTDELNDENASCEIYDKEQIEALKMGAFLAVNKGSLIEPRLIHLKYQPLKNQPVEMCLIGKGLMYDTGGYSLKQTMNTMKCDMAGAATVLGVYEAVVKNKLQVNLSIVICATDNKVSSEGLLPDDIVTSMSGKTIEIVSTDAEGRLTLADAVTFAQFKGYNNLLDIATLTGGVVTALGDMTTGLFTNDDQLYKLFNGCAINANESVWMLPITDTIVENVKSSKVADLINSVGRNASSCSAAAFIQEFVEKGTKWIHLDIAGTAFHTAPKYNESYGATGAMVRSIYNYIKSSK